MIYGFVARHFDVFDVHGGNGVGKKCSKEESY